MKEEPTTDIKFVQPKYECPKHGVHSSAIISTFKGNEGIWCMICCLETLDKLGVCRVKEIKEAND